MNASAPITAVTVNYNAGEGLRALVTALAAEPQVGRIAVVDNASRDGSLGFLTGNSDPRVTLVQNPRNLGFAAACNQGAALATTDYLLFINPDCRIHGSALASLLHCLESNLDAGMAGPLILNTDGSEQRGCRRYLPDPQRALMRVLGLGKPDAYGRVAGVDLTGAPLPSGPAEVEAISGACMLVRRGIFEKIGGWDEGYFLHCEDLDLCMRLRRAGFRTLFVPDALVTHVQGVSSRGLKVFVLWHKHRGMWRYFSKFQRSMSSAWLIALVWFGIWARFLVLLPGAWLASMGARSETRKDGI